MIYGLLVLALLGVVVWVMRSGQSAVQAKAGANTVMPGEGDEQAQEAEYRRLAEEELELLGVFFQSQDGVIITDAEGHILRVNDAFQAITGYTAREVIGHNPRMLSSGQHDAKFYEDMWREIREQGKWSGEVWNRRKNGEIFPEWLTITAVRDKHGDLTHYVGSFSDISNRKQTEEEMRLLALYDPLTKLPNRRLLSDRLFLAFHTSARSRKYGAVLFIDMDNFKSVNDHYGHEMGDRLLLLVTERLAGCVRDIDTVARWGGDEFVVVLSELAAHEPEAAMQVERISEKILAALRRPFNLGESECRCTASLGASLFLGHEQGVDVLLSRADTAMYRAKAEGRDALRFFDADMQTGMASRLALESDLALAVGGRQFRLDCQPQFDVEGRCIGLQALLCWKHPQRGEVAREEFMSALENSGLSLPLGRWMLEQVCLRLVAWKEMPDLQRLQVAVRVGVRQFRQPDFVEQVVGVLEESGADPARLRIELAEQALLEDIDQAMEKIWVLKQRGVHFSLADFGVGYSSLSHVLRLPFDQVKVASSFVRDVVTDPHAEALVRTILAMAQGMAVEVVAEGVATEMQYDILKRHGCRHFQGDWLARAMPAEGLTGSVAPRSV